MTFPRKVDVIQKKDRFVHSISQGGHTYEFSVHKDKARPRDNLVFSMTLEDGRGAGEYFYNENLPAKLSVIIHQTSQDGFLIETPYKVSGLKFLFFYRFKPAGLDDEVGDLFNVFPITMPTEPGTNDIYKFAINVFRVLPTEELCFFHHINTRLYYCDLRKVVFNLPTSFGRSTSSSSSTHSVVCSSLSSSSSTSTSSTMGSTSSGKSRVLAPATVAIPHYEGTLDGIHTSLVHTRGLRRGAVSNEILMDINYEGRFLKYRRGDHTYPTYYELPTEEKEYKEYKDTVLREVDARLKPCGVPLVLSHLILSYVTSPRIAREDEKACRSRSSITTQDEAFFKIIIGILTDETPQKIFLTHFLKLLKEADLKFSYEHVERRARVETKYTDPNLFFHNYGQKDRTEIEKKMVIDCVDLYQEVPALDPFVPRPG